MESYRYRNVRPRLIILRCIGSCNFFLEKVILPWEDWCFDAPPGSRVEIWSYGLTGVELLDSSEPEALALPVQNDPEAGQKPLQPRHSGLLGAFQEWPAGAPSSEAVARS
jgi:hypothetical protein